MSIDPMECVACIEWPGNMEFANNLPVDPAHGSRLGRIMSPTVQMPGRGVTAMRSLAHGVLIDEECKRYLSQMRRSKFLISWRTRAFYFGKTVKPLEGPIPTLPLVPAFEVESMCFRPPRRPSKHRRRDLSGTPRPASDRLVSPVVSRHIRHDRHRHPSETMS